MKICLFGITQVPLGKQNVKDVRLDEADKFVKAKKRTYIQVDLVGEDGILEADAILILKDARMDLILRDLEFTDTRLSRNPSEQEKALLTKIKAALEKEEFIMNLGLSEEENKLIAGATFLTNKPVVVAESQDLEDLPSLLCRALKESGYLSFLTLGEKESRAWLIKKGASAWEASGAIHSDIQKGFIRAEIISFEDYMAAGGEIPAKQAGKQRLEQKDYAMQDCDVVNFRFNKG